MSKKKDCFASETHVCRTKDCPYMSECVKQVWEKKVMRQLGGSGIIRRRRPETKVPWKAK